MGSQDFIKQIFKTWKAGWPAGAALKEKLSSRTRNQGGETTDDIIIETISQNLDIDIAPHDIKRSHRIGQLRQPGEKECPIIVKFVLSNNRNKIFRNKKKLKGKKISITESLTANRMEKLKEARELHGFRNVWTNDGKILCKLESNDKQQLYYG